MEQIVKSIVSLHFLPISIKIYNFCQPCHMKKSHKFPFPSSFTIYEHPLELIVLDIWGPAPLVSNNGFRYYLYLWTSLVGIYGLFRLPRNMMH